MMTKSTAVIERMMHGLRPPGSHSYRPWLSLRHNGAGPLLGGG